MGKISLVLPIYNEQLVLKDVLIKYIADLENLRKQGYEWEIIAVDDCSADESKLILIDFAKRYRNFKVVSLTGRFGKHAAVAAGFDVATGSLVITTEIDIQNPLGLLESLVREHVESKMPIVYGYREFTGWQKRKALFTDRMTRFSAKMFVLDGYFNGIVNAELYTADVVDILRAHPARNKYMRTMNNWVGWQVREFWYASEYSTAEAKIKNEQLRKRNKNYKKFRSHAHVNSASNWYGLLFLLFALVGFGLGGYLVTWAEPLYYGIMFTVAFWLLAIALMFFMRALLLRRIGNLVFKPGEVIYEIKSILNQ